MGFQSSGGTLHGMGQIVHQALLRLHMGEMQGDQPGIIHTFGLHPIEEHPYMQKHALHSRHMANLGRTKETPLPCFHWELDSCILDVGGHIKSSTPICKHAKANSQKHHHHTRKTRNNAGCSHLDPDL